MREKKNLINIEIAGKNTCKHLIYFESFLAFLSATLRVKQGVIVVESSFPQSYAGFPAARYLRK